MEHLHVDLFADVARTGIPGNLATILGSEQKHGHSGDDAPSMQKGDLHQKRYNRRRNPVLALYGRFP